MGPREQPLVARAEHRDRGPAGGDGGCVRRAVDPDGQTRHRGRLDPGKGIREPRGDPPAGLGRSPGPHDRHGSTRVECADPAPDEQDRWRLIDPTKAVRIARIVEGQHRDAGRAQPVQDRRRTRRGDSEQIDHRL